MQAAMSRMKVSAIMRVDVFTVSSDTTLDQALKLMDDQGIRHLPVVEQGDLVGVVSDRDLLEATGWLPSRVHACRGPNAENEIPKSVQEIMHAPVVSVAADDTVVTATVQFLARGIGCLPVVEGRKLVGILTEMDFLDAYTKGFLVGPSEGGMDSIVERRMSQGPTTIRRGASLGNAIDLCRSNGVRHLPVLEADRLVGVVSDRDLRKAVGRGRHEDMPIDEIVSSNLVTVTPDTALWQAARQMYEHRFSSLPVLDGDDFVGILTLSDVLEHCLDKCQGGTASTRSSPDA